MASEPTLPTAVLEKSPSNQALPPLSSSPTPSDTADDANDRNPNTQGKINAYATSFHPGRRFYAAFSSLLVITLMVAVEATTLSVAIPKITASLYASRST